MNIDNTKYDVNDPLYIPCLDHGFVYLCDHMGDDTSITQAARVSYGSGTKSVREDRGLIRYLFRHAHSSPVEMCEVKFHLKLPIFVMRQIARHRTANTNEYSGRYSIMTDEFYIPQTDAIAPQSKDNKQGRGGDIDEKSKNGVRWMMETVYEHAYDCYQALLGERDPEKFIQGDVPYAAYDDDDQLFDETFSGISRELARTVLPVGNYTECYWKIDLSNLLKFLKLRLDPHTQYETRVFAEAMYKLIQPIFPIACEAANDYMFAAATLSRMEIKLVKALLHGEMWDELALEYNNDMKAIASKFEMSERELLEFVGKFVTPS